MRQKIMFFSTLFSVLVVTIACLASPGVAATPTITAGDEKLWDHGGAYLIVALVKEVAPVVVEPNEAATHILTLQPVCTLAGEFDPSKNPEIRARAWIDEKHVKYGHSSMVAIPAKGTPVLVLIVQGNIGDDGRRPFPWVASAICTFMPEKYGLVAVKDLNDARITETLERIRRGRIPTDDDAVDPVDGNRRGQSPSITITNH
jgi:hypothetical protein